MPSGTDAYLINGNALHSVLYLPVGTGKCLPLHDERLKETQEKISNGVPADTTHTRFLTMPSPSPNLCDSNEQTNQTPEDR